MFPRQWSRRTITIWIAATLLVVLLIGDVHQIAPELINAPGCLQSRLSNDSAHPGHTTLSVSVELSAFVAEPLGPMVYECHDLLIAQRL